MLVGEYSKEYQEGYDAFYNNENLYVGIFSYPTHQQRINYTSGWEEAKLEWLAEQSL